MDVALYQINILLNIPAYKLLFKNVMLDRFFITKMFAVKSKIKLATGCTHFSWFGKHFTMQTITWRIDQLTDPDTDVTITLISVTSVKCCLAKNVYTISFVFKGQKKATVSWRTPNRVNIK